MGGKVKTRSAKNKGVKLQNFIRDELKPLFPTVTFKTALMGESGVDIHAYGDFPYSIEAKNQETWSIPQWWKQTLANTEQGRKPLLVVKKNRTEPLVILRWIDFKELL